MRLRGFLLISTLCIVLLFFILYKYIALVDYHTCDITLLNDKFKSIEKDMRLNINIKELEEKYSCNIILKDEKGYGNDLYASIKHGDAIFDYLEDDQLKGKIIFPINTNSFKELKNKLSIVILIAPIIIIAIIYTLSLYIYRRILLPFHLLENFAANISVGNLEIPLSMDRNNYFGAFTESFDMMREELKKAKQGEYEANISKKELVAGLSHDIKTPVATIKALCEILEIKSEDADTLTKIHTINQKADIIDKLISNMFHATLEELEVLKIEPKEEFSIIIAQMFLELNPYDKIHIMNELPECLIYADKLRLNQVIDNVINNSYKYANTDINITYGEKDKYITIEIKDFGSSISESEIPLVLEKFFRGKNSATHSGSGLGLYLAKQFMEGMEGGIECYTDNGFGVLLTIKKV
jgi:signal transduction histidine kinase